MKHATRAWISATELEYQKPMTGVEAEVDVWSWPLIGGGLIVLLSMALIHSARSRNRRRRAERRVHVPLVSAMMQLEDAASVSRSTEAPLPEEFRALIAEINEMIPSFEDAPSACRKSP